MCEISDKIRAILIFPVILIVCLFTCCKDKELVEYDGGHRMVMGTFARVVVVAKDSGTTEKCVEEAFDEIHKVDRLMSDYKDDSEISRINREGFEKAVKVSRYTYEVLRRSIEMSEISDGAFDVTVKPLVELWQKAGEVNSIPKQDEIERIRAKVGYKKLILDANSMNVGFKVKGMKIDLGGIAKGYAVDKAVETIQSNGGIGGMVDIGGEIRCFGVPPGERDGWVVGLQNPQKNAEIIGTEGLLLKLKLKGLSIATSGDYNRFELIDGKKHSHIIKPDTGTGTKGLCSVTIIAKNTTDADALATAVSVMGEKTGMELIESLEDTEAILISSDGFNVIKSSGADKYILR
ncbi:MAG: FAD:protein FMN transferase [Planctomycetota bacterium]|jgi:thiamine biosynthesis lipoprotein